MSHVDSALSLIAAGLSVVPITQPWEDPSQSKPLNFEWKRFQAKLMVPVMAEVLFEDAFGVCVICGKISGGLLCLDFDEPGYYEEWSALCDGTGIDVSAWPVQRTTNGGHHVFVRCESPGGNRKLAWAEDPATARANGKSPAIAIETRGEGGLVYIAPTPGYEFIRHSLAETPTVDQEDVEGAIAIARSLCKSVVPEAQHTTRIPAESRAGGDGARPGDIYNERMTWDQILAPEGHRRGVSKGKLTYWTRSGKKAGVSMVTGLGHEEGQDLLHVHTTNAYPLGGDTTYDKFGAFAALQHGGDFAKAAIAVAEEFGIPRPTQQARMEEAKATTTTGNVLELQLGANPEHTYNFTDLGNAERLAFFMDGRFRWSKATGWMVWDGKRFAHDPNGQSAKTAFIDMVRIMYAQAGAMKDDKARTKMAGWAEKCEADARMSSCIKVLVALPGIAIDPEEFDADPWLLNVQNGVLDIKTGDIEKHHPKFLMRKICNTEYLTDWDGTPPENLIKLLRYNFQSDKKSAEWLLRFAGYSLSGDRSEQKFAFLWGQAGAGKSTFMEIIEYILGDYCQRFPTPMLMKDMRGPRATTTIPSEIATLAGSRLVLAPEVEEGEYFNEFLLRSITGEKHIRTRMMYKEWFSMPVTFKLWVTGNNQPNIKNFDAALRRRINVIPFNRTVAPEDKDLKMPEKLIGEASTILTYLVAACQDYLESGLSASDSMIETLNEYERDNDRVGAFFNDHCEAGYFPSLLVTFASVYKRYRQYCFDSGMHPESAKSFSNKMKSKGHPSHIEAKGLTTFKTLRLLDHDSEASNDG